MKASLLILLMVPVGIAFGQRIPDHPAKLEYPPLRWDIPAGKPYLSTTSVGMRTFVAEDHTLPLVRVTGYCPGGSLLDPPGKEGAFSLCASLLRSGGTSGISPEQFDAVLDLFAISISVKAAETHVHFSASFLSEYTDTAMALLFGMLSTPRFDTTRLARDRAIMIDRIRHRWDNPEPVLSALSAKVMYPGQENSRLSTVTSVSAVTRDDLVACHRQILIPREMVIGISGDIDTEKARNLFDRYFPASADSVLPLPRVSIQPDLAGAIAHKQVTQSTVALLFPLFARPHPDYYAVSLLNTILGGGGFTSRLGEKVRSDAGLTYAIYSRAESNYRYPGLFKIIFQTATENTARALELTVKECTRIREDGVTRDELEHAVSYLIDGFPSLFRDAADIVENYAWSAFYGRDLNHYLHYPDQLKRITTEDLLRVARTYLDPDSMHLAVVADTATLTSDNFYSFIDRSEVKSVLPDSLAEME